uniref:CHK domain-containing protein n=1 Tax=Rhabditophanes sp. KR3021 TaxID=114890 RepID=A0AC35TUY4_9BILA
MQNAIVKMHNRECDFYTKFTFEGIPIPKVFNVTYWQPNIKQKGCLLMKDLSVDSKDVDFSESLNVSQAFQIAESISQLQVYSIINKEEIESLELFSPFKDVEFDEVVKKRIPTFITEYDNELGDEARQVLATAASDPQFEHFINTEACSRFDLPQVLSHADIWTNNIFFKKDKYGNATSELKCIMDWQLFIKSNPAHDLARFMVLSLDGDVRRKYSKSINQHYYNILSKELALKNHTVPFTFENYEKMYDYCYVHQAVQMLLMVSIFLTHTNFDKTEAQYKRGFTEKLILRTKHVLEDANICIQTMNGEWKE